LSDFSDYEEFTWIATIVGVRGVIGELRVKYFTNSPEYYLNTKLFFLEYQNKLLPKCVRSFKTVKKGWLIVFEGIESRNDAEKIKGCRLLIPDKQLKPLEKNEFFVHQLIGCRVEDKSGCFLGNVTDYLETGANNVFEVQNEKNEFLVPDVPHVVMELNIKRKRIIIDRIPGLI